MVSELSNLRRPKGYEVFVCALVDLLVKLYS